MAPASSDRPAGERPARWTAAAGGALILSVSVATWWVVGPQKCMVCEAPPKPPTMAEHVVGVVACVVGVAAAVALAVATRAGRMDLRWRPVVVALSLAGALTGMALRSPLDDFGATMIFLGPFWLALVVYAMVRIPPYNPPPKK
jgi:hypothetical protein